MFIACIYYSLMFYCLHFGEEGRNCVQVCQQMSCSGQHLTGSEVCVQSGDSPGNIRSRYVSLM